MTYICIRVWLYRSYCTLLRKTKNNKDDQFTIFELSYTVTKIYGIDYRNRKESGKYSDHPVHGNGGFGPRQGHTYLAHFGFHDYRSKMVEIK